MLISEKQRKTKKQKKLRNAEYYDMTSIFDDLYDKSKNNAVFTNLMELISSRENILLAYRNIKKNDGSMTAGVITSGRNASGFAILRSLFRFG